MISRVDIKTWVILILAVIIVVMSLFGKGGDTTALETLLKEKEKENAILQEKEKARNDTIADYQEKLLELMKKDTLNESIILALEELREKQERDINFLKKKMKDVDKPINEATDQERIEFWRAYFLRKGIKP
jgi:vacuolar-type H+-ATPase subunit I/STV1